MAFIPGLRFRKSIGILPGVKFNISKTGVSTSLGGRGATVNVGTRSRTATFGIPGTGLSYRMPLGGSVVVVIAILAARRRPVSSRALPAPAQAGVPGIHLSVCPGVSGGMDPGDTSAGMTWLPSEANSL